MSKEKQIEEMIEAIKPFVSGFACGEESGSCELTDCRTCKARNLANGIYNAGYRKQSEWISVNDDTPKNELERVLVLLEDNDITHTIGTHKIDTDRFVNGKWARWGKWVTHWAPLSDTLKGE